MSRIPKLYIFKRHQGLKKDTDALNRSASLQNGSNFLSLSVFSWKKNQKFFVCSTSIYRIHTTVAGFPDFCPKTMPECFPPKKQMCDLNSAYTKVILFTVSKYGINRLKNCRDFQCGFLGLVSWAYALRALFSISIDQF